MEIVQRIAEQLQEGSAKKVRELCEQAVAQDIPATVILGEGLIAGMEVVGRKFKCNEMFLPEVLVVARAMKAGMEVIQPLLAKANVKAPGKVAVGTVKGDIHDIGKNLVLMMLKGAGYDVIDLGVDVPDEKFAECVERDRPDVLGMSALLTTTMGRMRQVIGVLETRQLRDKVKVIIGGAPISGTFAKEIQADGYARDAASAVDVVKALLAPVPHGS